MALFAEIVELDPWAVSDAVHFALGVAAGLISKGNTALAYLIVGVYVLYQLVDFALHRDALLKDLAVFAVGLLLGLVV